MKRKPGGCPAKRGPIKQAGTPERRAARPAAQGMHQPRKPQGGVHSLNPFPLTHSLDPLHSLSLASPRTVSKQGAMENRNVAQQDLVANEQPPTEQMGEETSLKEAELHALVEFFQLLDRWDREVVQ